MSITSKPRNACFIHSTTMDKYYDEKLQYLLNRIMISGLGEQLDFIFINNIGIPLVDKYRVNTTPILLENYSQNVGLYETCTIRTIHQFCKLHPNYNILYLHTKGVYEEDHFQESIQAWVHYMMSCLVDKYQECIQLLSIYDTVGTNMRERSYFQKNPQHYSGNFWWSTARYIDKLPICGLHERDDSEFWLMNTSKEHMENSLFFNFLNLGHMYEIQYHSNFYQKTIENKMQEKLYFSGFGNRSKIGLCNQLYSLINVLIMAKVYPGFSTVIIDDFLTDIDTNEHCDSRTVLDFSTLNAMIKKYNIRLIHKSDVQMELVKVLYGTDISNQVDITETIRARFFHENKVLYIPPKTNINDLCPNGDPVQGIPKQMSITYTINGRTFMEHFDEQNTIDQNEAIIDFKDYHTVQWSAHRTSVFHSKGEKELFDELLAQMPFQYRFHQLANDFLKNSFQTDVLSSLMEIPINVMHLRLEEDAIPFWGMINRISPQEYESALVNKYIKIVEQYFDKNSTTIIVSMKTDNPVCDYMRENGYKLLFMDKTKVIGRELNAIVDLLISTHCNRVFVGNALPHKFNGSTFSYTIFNKLRNKPNVLKLCIDCDHIYDPVQEYR